MWRSLAITALAAGVAAIFGSGIAIAQPNRTPVRIIVPFAPGGTNDVVARILADGLPHIMGKPAIVENRPGAGGNQGADSVYYAPADGDMLLVSPMPLLAINPHVYHDMRFDPMKFSAISILVRYPVVLVARNSLPVVDAKDLVSFAKKNPGKLTFASQGVGAIGHVAFQRFADAVGINATHVPYRGNGPAINDLLGGHVDLLVTDLIGVLPGIQDGRLKLLGVSGERRLLGFQNVPTLDEVAPGVVIDSWIGLVTTPNTSTAVLEKLSAAVSAIFAEPSVRSKLEALQATADGSGSEAMRSSMERETKIWSDVIRNWKIVP